MKRRDLIWMAASLLAGLLLASTCYGAGPLRTRIAERRDSRQQVDVEPAGLFFRRTRPSTPSPQWEPMPAYLVSISSNGSGTCGSIIGDDLVLSCSHGKSTNIVCTFNGGQKATATILARDAEADVCLLQVDTPDGCEQLSLAESAPMAGESITYQGRGGGYSARPAVVQVLRESWIQSSGYVYPGDSGGAIRNKAGELAGVIHHKEERGSGAYGTHATWLREWIGDRCGPNQEDCPCPPELPPETPEVVPDSGSDDTVTPPKRQRKPRKPKPQAPNTPPEQPNGPLEPPETTPQENTVPPAKAKDTDPKHAQIAGTSDDGNPILGAAVKYGLPVAATALGVTMPPAFVGLAGYGAFLALSGWRKKRQANKATEAKAREAKTAEKAERFPCVGSIPRDMEEAKQLLQLSQLEGREPLSDAIIGRFAIDEIETACEALPDGDERNFFIGLQRRLMDKFNAVAPVATRN